MRLTVLRQCTRGLPSPRLPDTITSVEALERDLESVKHYLWHGNIDRARERLELVEDVLDGWFCDEEGEEHLGPGKKEVRRMLKYVRDLRTYLRHNAGSIVNYGERYRNGERISTSFVESTVNQVVSKRMVKKQQMQWTPEGAHLLLQVRIQVLNQDWVDTFRSWYPKFRPPQTPDPVSLVA